MGLLDFLQGTLGIGGGPDINQTIAGGGITPGGFNAGQGQMMPPEYMQGQQQQQQMQSMMRKMMLSAVLSQVANRNNPRAGNPMGQMMPMMFAMMKMQQGNPLTQARIQQAQAATDLSRQRAGKLERETKAFEQMSPEDQAYGLSPAELFKFKETHYINQMREANEGLRALYYQQQEKRGERAEERGKEKLGLAQEQGKRQEEALDLRRDVLEHPEKYPGAAKGKTGEGPPLPEYPGVTNRQYSAGLHITDKYYNEKAAYEGIINDYGLAQKDMASALAGNGEAGLALADAFSRAAQGFDPHLGRRMSSKQVDMIRAAQPGGAGLRYFLSGQGWITGNKLSPEGTKNIVGAFHNLYEASQERLKALEGEYVTRGTGAGLPEGAMRKMLGVGASTAPAKAGGIPPPPAGMKKASEYMKYLQSKGYSTEEAYKAAQDAAGGQ